MICASQNTCYHLGTHWKVWKAHADTTVHDHFTAYLSPQPDEINHGVCNAHRLREVRDVADHWCETTGGPVLEPIRVATAAA